MTNSPVSHSSSLATYLLFSWCNSQECTSIHELSTSSSLIFVESTDCLFFSISVLLLVLLLRLLPWDPTAQTQMTQNPLTSHSTNWEGFFLVDAVRATKTTNNPCPSSTTTFYPLILSSFLTFVVRQSLDFLCHEQNDERKKRHVYFCWHFSRSIIIICCISTLIREKGISEHI